MKYLKNYFLLFNILSLFAIVLLSIYTVINGDLGGTQNALLVFIGGFLLNLHPLLSLIYMTIYFFWAQKAEDSFNIKLVLYSPVLYWLLFMILIMNYAE